MPAPIQQLLSRTVHATDGSTTNWDFSFAGGYIDKSHVKAYTTNEFGTRVDLAIVPDTQLIGEFQLQITPALPDGLELTIYRDTPKDAPIVDFADRSAFAELALDTNAKQAVFLAAEAQDAVSSVDLDVFATQLEAAAAAAESALASASSATNSEVAAQVAESAAQASAVAAQASAVAAQASAVAANEARDDAEQAVADLSASLASPDGASSIGCQQDSAGAIPRTAQEKLREQYTLLDISSNTIPGVTDMSPALNQARASAGGRKIRIPAGHYKFNSVCSGTTDLIIEGDGDSTILDFTGAVAGGNYALDATGTATLIEDLSGTQAAGSHDLLFASAPSLVVGDVFVIFNPTPSSFSGFRASYYAGEWCEVESITGSAVKLRSPLYESYNATDVDVYKITGPKVQLSNFAIRGTSVLGLIKPTLCIEPLITNVKGDHSNNSVVLFDRCYKPVVNMPRMKNIGDGGDDYGIVFGNTQHGRIYGGDLYSRRHAVTTGGNDTVCSVPCRDIITEGVILKNDITTLVSAADFHGNTTDSRYINCTISGGVNLQGKNNGYDGCRVYADGGGRILLCAEIKGGTFHLRDCEFFTSINPQTNSRGILDFGGQNAAFSNLTTEDCTIIVSGNTLNGKNLSTTTSFVNFRNFGAAVKVNFNVSDNTANVDAMGNILRTALLSGTAASDFIVVDGNTGFKPAAQASAVDLHSASGSHYLNFPHRLLAQSGRESLTALSGTNITTGTPYIFPYSYPRPPDAQAGGEIGFAGTVAVLIGLGAPSATQIVPRLISGSGGNWTSNRTVTCAWVAAINEC